MPPRSRPRRPRGHAPDAPAPPPGLPPGERPAAGEEIRRVAGPDGSLHLRIRGQGVPVLCLHGLTAHGGVWNPVADALADRFRLFMPDLLSRGRSDPRPDRPHDLPRELQRLDAVRDLLPPRPFLVLGHSHGAALAVALSHRARVVDRPGPAGWILVTPVTPWTDRPPVLEVFTLPAVRRALGPAAARLRIPITRQVLERRAYGDPSRVDAAAVRRYAAPFRDRERAVALLRILADWRPGELSAHVPVEVPPARVIAGGQDRRIPAAEARRWARALGAEFRLAPDAGHMVPEERPDLVADAVRRVARRTGALD